MEPRIQYAKTADGVSIAFCVAGEGSPLMFLPRPPMCHVQLDWQVTFSYLYQALARNHRFVWFDWPGAGLSDRDAIDFSMDAMVRSVEAVVARTGLEEFALSGHAGGALIAVTYAVAQPERVSHLILADGWTKFSELEGSPLWEAEKTLRDKDWVIYTETVCRVLWGIEDQEFARQVAEYLSACVEPDAHRAAFAAMERYDVSDLLPRVTAQTLVVHNQRSPYGSVQVGQRLAAHIANARFMVVDDPTHAQMPALIDDFLGEGEEPAAAPAEAAASGGFRTVLFTDVEGSTALTQRLGDAKAQDVLRTHNAIVRGALKAQHGSEIKHTGDGIMASFTSASRALECAIAIQRALAQHNESNPDTPIRVRIGLSAGEPVAEEKDLFGTAVQLAARITAKAEAEEILVSDTLRGLVAGKGFLFSDRGDVALRGFEDPVRLFEVRWREES